MIKNLFGFLVTFTLLLGVTADAFAQTLVTQPLDRAARTNAMGNTGASNSRGTDAILHNPANLALEQNYIIEAGYTYRHDSHTMGASVIDSKTNPMVAAGIGYSFVLGSNNLENIQGHDIVFGIAVPILSDRLSLGAGGRYTWMKQKIKTTGGTANNKNNENEIELINGFNLNAGLNFRLIDRLSLGFSALNLIPQCEKTFCKAALPMTFRQGLSYSNWGFSIAVDVDIDIDRANEAAIDVGAGAEYVIAEMVPVRFGYRYVDIIKGNMITTGLGFTSAFFDANLTYQVNVSHVENSHVVFATLAVKL